MKDVFYGNIKIIEKIEKKIERKKERGREKEWERERERKRKIKLSTQRIKAKNRGKIHIFISH